MGIGYQQKIIDIKVLFWIKLAFHENNCQMEETLNSCKWIIDLEEKHYRFWSDHVAWCSD